MTSHRHHHRNPCVCSFVVAGAEGGSVFDEMATTVADVGGAPAVVSGNVALTIGQVIYIVVGQTPWLTLMPAFAAQFGGGGGGTFVFLGDLSTPLLVAGRVFGV